MSAYCPRCGETRPIKHVVKMEPRQRLVHDRGTTEDGKKVTIERWESYEEEVSWHACKVCGNKVNPDLQTEAEHRRHQKETLRGAGLLLLIVAFFVACFVFFGWCAARGHTVPTASTGAGAVAAAPPRSTTPSIGSETIAVRRCRLFEEASPRTKVMATLDRHDAVDVLQEWNGWRRVRTADGVEGWTGPVCWPAR